MKAFLVTRKFKQRHSRSRGPNLTVPLHSLTGRSGFWIADEQNRMVEQNDDCHRDRQAWNVPAANPRNAFCIMFPMGQLPHIVVHKKRIMPRAMIIPDQTGGC